MHDLLRSFLHFAVLLLLVPWSNTVAGQDRSESGTTLGTRPRSLLSFADPTDSTAFHQFIQSLLAEAGPPPAGGPPKRYRQVWQVSEHGGAASVSRGDGQVITLEADRPIMAVFDTLFIYMRTTDGRTCVAKLWEVPCAMICRTTTYYLEE